MAHFQTVQPPPLSSSLQLPKQPPAARLERLSLHVGSEVTLELVGPSVNNLTITPQHWDATGDPKSVIAIAVTQATPTKQTFTVRALAAGKVLIYANDSAGNSHAAFLLIAGVFKNHKIGGHDLDVDLFANVSRGSNGHVINEVRKVLHNDANNLFDQWAAHNKHASKKIGNMTCGMVCKERSAQLFGLVSPLNYNQPYHETLKKVSQRSDVKYKPDTILAVKAKIIALLRAGTPVRVGVLDFPINMYVEQGKLIAWYRGGHTVVIVGWSAAFDSFLYVDTWRDGSKMIYNGGISGDQNPNECLYLGMMGPDFDSARVLTAGDTRKNLLRGWPSTEGTEFNTARGSFLEIVAGP